MTAPRQGRPTHSDITNLPKDVPKIALRHGEALWVLSQLGFPISASKSKFYAYIQSLRRLHTPFEPDSIGLERHGLANYSYGHLMELALVLAVRVYQNLPEAIVIEIVRYRQTLYRCYHRAYSERMSGLGAPIDIHVEGHKVLILRGVFLDLQIDFSGGKLTAFGPPKLLSPNEALSALLAPAIATRALLPINLSALSERLVSIALRAPTIRRGYWRSR